MTQTGMTQTGSMRILLKLVLDCEPDAAWNAIRSPDVFRAVSFPLTTFESLEPGGFPQTWPEGAHRVLVRAFGLVPVGQQTIDVAFTERADGIRTVVDTGRGLTGPLTLVTSWEHTMAVSPAPGNRTLYRDQLKFDGPIVMWPVFWVFWQWRALGLKRLAPAWY